MKTIILSLSILLSSLAIPFHAFANNIKATVTNVPEYNNANPQAAIFQKIQSGMHVPNVMKGTVSSERVRVVFTIDENGHAHVLDVNTNRVDLKESVIKQLEAIDFSDSQQIADEQYSIWLNFKVM